MDISELVNKMNNKEISTKEVAEKYKVSTRTVQNRIRKQGYIYDNKKSQWIINNDPNKVSSNISVKEKKPITKSMIQELLTAKPTPNKNRTFRGFYLDTDILEVLDSVPTGKRSDLINEVLREAFKEHNRL